MSSPVAAAAHQVEKLALNSYNATVTSIRRCHRDLAVFRVRPDRGIPPVSAGQYTVLGLGYWEPRVAGCQEEGDIESVRDKLIKRAYSVSSPLLDGRDELVTLQHPDYLEFYIALVRRADAPPALTPRLFALQPGARIFCGPHMHGHYTLSVVPRHANVVLAGTGTGEAPHNAMVSQLLKTGHRGSITHVVCVRHTEDLAYLETHRRLEKRFANYRYLPLTTREPENLVPTAHGYVGKRYLQDYVQSGDLEKDAGIELLPETTHVFLCGNPDMIGVPLRTHDAQRRYPSPVGMVEVLERRGFEIDRPHHPGNIHFEKYW